jgi:uncharacterized protein YjiS (DUF1127 family)
MTAFDLSRPAAARPAGTIFSDLLGRVVAWRERRATLDMLSALTDRELDDIGLNRVDLNAGRIRRR